MLLSFDPVSPLLGISYRNNSTEEESHMCESVDFSVIYNDEKLETVKMSNNGAMPMKIMVYLPNGFMQPYKIIIALFSYIERCL